VVICPPFGFEYVHGHRSLLHLSDRIAADGFAVLRLEYTGTGNSTGDEGTEGLVQAWLDDIEGALSFGERLTGGPPTVVGLRLGALLAGVTASRRDVHSLVAWAPVLRGKRFVREIRALHKVSASRQSQDEGFLQAGGFRASAETAEALSALTFPGSPVRILTQALVIDRTDQPIARLPDTGSLGVPTTRAEQSDYADMMAEPHFTHLPLDTIGRIADWLGDVSAAPSVPLDSGVLREVSASRTAKLRSPDGSPLTEEAVIVTTQGGGAIFGVLSRPEGVPVGDEVVLLTNAGSVHHMGPNRLYVELARELGASGIASFRFDLRNLGDARIGENDEENHPYPSTAIEDIGLAVRWLTGERRFGSCTIAGLCSGAHAAFHAAIDLDLPEIAGIVCINPLTFAFKEGMSLETPISEVTSREATYYRAALRDPEKWRRLFRGQTSIPYLFHFVGRRLRQRADSSSRLLLRRMRLRRPGSLERDLLRLHELGRRVRFVFSSADPGRELLADQARVTIRRLTRAGTVATTIIPDADHTFSRKQHRLQVIRAVRRLLDARGGPVTCRVVRSGSPLWSTMRPIWAALRADTGDTSAFLSETWIGQWLDWFGKTRNARGLIWSDSEGMPVGCAFLTTDRAAAGPFSVSRVFLNASGVHGVGCEHNDVLVHPAYRDAVVVDLATQMAKLGTDQIALSGISHSLFERLVYDRFVPWDGLRSDAPYASLAALRVTGKSFVDSLSANTRRQIRRSIRGYESRFGPLSYSVATTPEVASEMLDELLLLHDARWTTETETSGFTPEGRRFHAELIQRLFATDPPTDLAAILCRIRFGEETIGVLYHLLCGRRVQFFQGGLRYHDDPKLKPGMVSHALSAQHCLEQGFDEYDLLGGEPVPIRYKTSLTTHRRALYWGTVYRPTRKARLVSGLRYAVRGVRGVLPSQSAADDSEASGPSA